MKLAIALSERADLSAHIQQLSHRLYFNAKVQEGDTPSEDPQELMEELDRSIARLEELIARINHTNNMTKNGNETLTDLLAKRDCITSKVEILRHFLHLASERVTRGTKTEIKVLSSVNVPELQKKVDALSKELRFTDERIQEMNWTTELI